MTNPVQTIFKCFDVSEQVEYRVILAAVAYHDPHPPFVCVIKDRLDMISMFCHLGPRIQQDETVPLTV